SWWNVARLLFRPCSRPWSGATSKCVGKSSPCSRRFSGPGPGSIPTRRKLSGGNKSRACANRSSAKPAEDRTTCTMLGGLRRPSVSSELSRKRPRRRRRRERFRLSHEVRFSPTHQPTHSFIRTADRSRKQGIFGYHHESVL